MECIKQDPVSLNRILWLDALKCFAMFLVIWGHVIQYGVCLLYTSDAADD